MTDIQPLPDLKASIEQRLTTLKDSGDEATRQAAIALETELNDLVGRMARTIRLARNQRTAARLEHVKIMDVLENCDPHLAKMIVLAAQMTNEFANEQTG